jgi:hypothetical protein
MTDHAIKTIPRRFYSPEAFGGTGKFVGLDLEVQFGSGFSQSISGSAPLEYNNVRKDTGPFVSGAILFGVPAGSACVVTADTEGDWEVDLLCNFHDDGADNPIVVAAGIGLNAAFLTSGNFTGQNTASLPFDESITIAGYTLYGLVAGDVIWTWASTASIGISTNSNTEVRFRYLGPAS